MTTLQTPRTAAGRALLSDGVGGFEDRHGLRLYGSAAFLGCILAIEAEARDAALSDARAAVASGDWCYYGTDDREQSLAAIDALRGTNG